MREGNPDPAPVPPYPRVTVAVVNYNGRAFLKTCLSSLRVQERVDLEILFIDNASRDDSVAFVREHFPEIVIVENRENLGYAAALNQAIDRMQGRYLMPLNTDIKLEPDFVRLLVDGLERHHEEKCGCVQGKVRFMTEDFRPTKRLYSTGHLFPPNRLIYNRGNGQTDRGQYDSEEAVPGCNAACNLYSREMLEDMRCDYGVFDPLFFLYGNDGDFDWMAALRGWRCWYVPRALAWHIGEGSSRVGAKKYNAPFVNVRFLMMLKNDRWADLIRDAHRIIKRNIQDIYPKIKDNPPLLWQIPLDLLAQAGPALRSRRASQHLRAQPERSARGWMAWSKTLLMESGQWGDGE